MRTLAADIGAALDGGGHLRALRRTEIGAFRVEDGHDVEELATTHLLPSRAAVEHLASVAVGDDLAAAIANGAVLERAVLDLAGDGPWAVLGADGDLLAVYEPRDPAAWLHRTAVNLSRTAKARAARRRAHEREAALMAPACSADDEALRDWRSVLQEEVERLQEELAESTGPRLDLALMLAGWAPHRGGPCRYAEQVGYAATVATLEELAKQHGERFEPCAVLRRLAENTESNG